MRLNNLFRRVSFMLATLMLFSLCYGFSVVSPVVAADDPKPPQQSVTARIGQSLVKTTGPVQIVVQLKEQPLALTPGQNRSGQLSAAQNDLMSRLAKYGAKELARLQVVLNAVVIVADASQVKAIATEANVKSLRKLENYSLDLSETVPYIGGTAAQAQGYTGQGLKVAVLDSGVDYTHEALGGPGTLAAYEAAYGTSPADPRNKTRDGLFPTAKVYEGRDFVGEVWPNGALAIDDDPIDYEGHGTHVADIIAGKKGVAPKAQILAVKVCSAVASSCSGVALLQGVEYAVTSNVDVMNLSLGSDYGQTEDDLTEALNNAFLAGVVVVASAGNGADRPYKVGSPSIGFGVISVAQTAVPSDKLFPIKLSSGGTIRYSILQPWSPAPAAAITAPLQYGNGAGGNLLGCNPYPAGSLAGKILVVDRGTCAGSIKGSNGAAAGALAVIIVNNSPGAPPTFGFGGGNPTAPTFTVPQSAGPALKAPGVVATIDPANIISLAGTTVGTTSRGPSISNNFIKPDIAAPGGSISAEVGTGNDVTPFGGTSGAAPMVSGAALLVLSKNPNLSPLEVRAFLMNTAETNISTLDAEANKYLSPITAVGAGEVRVNRAVNTNLLVYVPEDNTASLSFGYQTVNNTVKVLYKTIRITNLSNQGRVYTISNKFRYANDEANGAVTFQSGFPRNEWVGPNSSRDIQIQLQINGPQLRQWNLNAGTNGNDGTTLNEPEYDGYITVEGGGDKATLPWQVLPRKVADVKVQSAYDSYVYPQGNTKVIQMSNDQGAGPGRVDVFNLLGTSPQKTGPAPAPGSNDTRIDLRYFGVRDVAGGVQFAVNTYEQRATPNYPAEFDIYVDTNNNGTADYVIYNGEFGGFGTDGRNVVTVVNLTTGGATAVSFSDATYNSGNILMTVPLAALGLTSGQKFGAFVVAFDNYFNGDFEDIIEGSAPGGFATYTTGQPRFKVAALPWTQPGVITGPTTLSITSNGAQLQAQSGPASLSTSSGLLLMYRDNGPNREAETVALP